MKEDVKRLSFGHLALAFMTGALAAVAATLLSAPVSGREARDYLRRAARRGKEVMAAAPDAIRRGFRRGKREMRGHVGEVADELT